MTRLLPARAWLLVSCALLVTGLLRLSWECQKVQAVIPVCKFLEDLPLTPLTSESNQVVFEGPGTIVAMHGSGGAKLASGKSPQAIKVEQSVPIPSYATSATVLLNGWHLSYLGEDQNVLQLGTLITNIRFDPRQQTLTWDAAALLRDDDAEEGYDWNYRFTVIAWNDTQIKAVVDHGGNLCSDNFFFNRDPGATTALSAFSSFVNNQAFTSSGTVAGVPRGFGFLWFGDHHLLQLAYNLDHTEIVVETKKEYQKGEAAIPAPLPTAASRADSGFVSWSPYAIFKDDDMRRDYFFGEVVSAFGGADVGVLQPPFSILPVEGNKCWAALGGPGVKTEDFDIENIPFEFAVPMLTGWEVRYTCDDQQVKEIGVWIDEWSYKKDPGGQTGTLHYKLSSVLHDDDTVPDYAFSHKVSVLGLRPLARLAAAKQ